MVKPDVKRNYYADLELPPTATVDDVRKAYRKLALQYHPDRNAGREEECIPKFQAIQAANEVLCDPTQKAKYDADRRRAGLFPGAAPRQPTMGNPYQATSAFPPPPRRTQPGTWQRPQPAAGAASQNGADRFTQFPRPSPTARKDPAQDRTNMFKAWQNMNNAQERQRNFTAPGQPPQPPPQQPQPNTRPRPPPPPRNPTNVATEERVRAGMNQRRAQSNMFDAANADPRQSAWSSFQQPAGPQPSAAQSNAFKTPRKAGFNPNTPGSDERAAPRTGSNYAQRRRSEDISGAGQKGTTGQSSARTSPSSPAGKPPARARTFDEPQAFAEANRERTPYAAFSGEKTISPAEQLRRSYSSRDTSKLNPDGRTDRGRARSTSPLGRQSAQAGDKPRPFVQYSSSDSSSDGDNEGTARPGTAPSGSTATDRPKKTPAPPSRRFDATSTHGASTVPPASGDAVNAAQTDSSRQSNMYGNSPSPTHTPFRTRDWVRAMFGSYSTSRAGSHRPQTIPKWAIPSSISPNPQQVSTERRQETFVTAADALYIKATGEERAAFLHLQAELRREYHHLPNNLDMDVFNKLVAQIRGFGTCGDTALDELVRRILVKFPSVGARETFASDLTDEGLRGNSFSMESFQRDPRFFAQPTKSRSSENINTNFSKEPWTGNFTGEPDYFGSADGVAKKPLSPTRRPGSAKSSQRSSTMDVPPDPNAAKDRSSPRPWGSDGLPRISVAEPDAAFSQAQWQKTFQDPSWTWPKNPSPLGPGASTQAGSTRPPQHVRTGTGDSQQAGTENAAAEGLGATVEDVDDGDAMDIDTPPTAQKDGGAKTARVYAVPPSAWRQQQAQQMQTSGQGKSRDGKINTSLDDLLNVEPLAPSTDSAGLKDLSDLSATLPFPSQSSASIRPITPRDLKLPDIPKAPEPPTKLTKTSWPAYSSLFGAYLKAFHALNSTMLQHFIARERLAQDSFAAGMDFLEASGDGTGMRLGGHAGGYGAYLQAVQEDGRVRETWTLACERHAEAVAKFGQVRDQVKRLTAAGGLVEA